MVLIGLKIPRVLALPMDFDQLARQQSDRYEVSDDPLATKTTY